MSLQYMSLTSTSCPGFDSLWKQIFEDFNCIVLLVVSGALVTREVSVVTLSIFKIYRLSLRKYFHRSRVYVHVHRDEYAL